MRFWDDASDGEREKKSEQLRRNITNGILLRKRMRKTNCK